MRSPSSNNHPDTQWVKSTRSTNNGHCVELRLSRETIAVRDSKNPHGAHLRFPTTAFTAFLSAVKNR
ncbi:DUF397 domain-containing protein [Actinoalloteichus hymeniacidonis]|uniref:DUF397 family protein n=1 Tax=Actinoalloteichus hymeniacidonis TaxID=340345 RepID=A0AAC9HTH4_9PSEU|nr:DUF397 domain-containing protein [Actinoalloteichus hymeniacidonis]AOS65332.1 putative DUF397 family protein [Actinoalloteichus hymeniacidonis]MBB5906582.1 hypothetical protein [Actinoalloteichus hymeniacidonis]